MTIDLASYAAEPRVQLRWRYSVAQGDAGFGAQVDQIRLACSPYLYSDNFESRLTTRWSTTASWPAPSERPRHLHAAL